MGKIVKYCANCEESFAEKFSYCPNCASGLTAYEMNPLAAIPVAEPIKADEPVKAFEPGSDGNADSFDTQASEPVAAEKSEDFKTQTEPQSASFLTNDYNSDYDDILNVKDDAAEESKPIIEEPKSVAANVAPITILPAAVASTTVDDYSRTYNEDSNGSAQTADYKASSGATISDNYKTQVTPSNKTYNSDGGYNITFVEEKNNGIRRLLLMGAFLLVTTATLGGVVISLYTSDALVGSLNEDMVLLAPGLIDAEQPPDPEPPKPKDEKQGGGGGGGGKEEKTETSKGVLATQMEKPMIAPSVTMDRVTKPAIPITMATEGKNQMPPSNEKYGNPNSLSTIPSDGTGTGGGQGSGTGRGQGSGRGGGAGSGIGTGMGGGIGDGNGDGTGSGGGPPVIRKPEPVGPTEAVRVTSKPRANYTDAARQNQVQGTVTLRVTFLANGSIGSISTISGLPNGLTEQAIAAARAMRFDPAKKGGVPYTVTKQVQYNFTLY